MSDLSGVRRLMEGEVTEMTSISQASGLPLRHPGPHWIA